MDRHVGRDFDGLVVDKLPLNMMSLPLIATLFPDARIVFAQRHPCDCVLSGFLQNFLLNVPMASFLEIRDAADLYDASMRLFLRGRERSDLPVHGLAYERLVEVPEEELRRTIDFLGLDWWPALLDHRATAARRKSIPTPSYDTVSQPLSRKPSGRWRHYSKQLEPVLPTLMHWAGQLGYEV